MRAVTYLRQSSDATGDELALARQRKACAELAAVKGWTILREYSDNNLSASNKRVARPKYNQMLADFAAGEFDAILCYDLDRLTRQPRQLEDLVDLAEERGLRIVTANGEADLSTDGGRMYARVKAAVAKAEVERKSKRQRDANAQRAEMGKGPQGPRLFGYVGTTQAADLRLKTGDPHPSEAPVVARLFADFVGGESIKGLATRLNDEGIPTRWGRPWTPTTIRHLLLNRRYAGRVIHKGQVVADTGETAALVDPELFDAAQAILADPRRQSGHGTDRKHLGSGLYVCDRCGHRVRAYAGRRYMCPTPGCGLSRVAQHIDALVEETVEQILRTHGADLLVRTSGGRVKELRAETGRLTDRLRQFEADYGDGLIDGRQLKASTDRINAELKRLEAELARCLDSVGPAQVLAASDPVQAFRDASLMMRRATVTALLEIRIKRGMVGARRFDPATVALIPAHQGLAVTGAA